MKKTVCDICKKDICQDPDKLHTDEVLYLPKYLMMPGLKQQLGTMEPIHLTIDLDSFAKAGIDCCRSCFAKSVTQAVAGWIEQPQPKKEDLFERICRVKPTAAFRAALEHSVASLVDLERERRLADGCFDRLPQVFQQAILAGEAELGEKSASTCLPMD